MSNVSKSFSVPLSRAHKFVERLTEKGNSLINEAKDLFAHKPLRTSAAAHRVATTQIIHKSASAKEKLEQGIAIMTVVAKLRSDIQDQNTKSGISDLMAELAVLNKLCPNLKAISSGFEGDFIDLSNALNLIARAEERGDNATPSPDTYIAFRTETSFLPVSADDIDQIGRLAVKYESRRIWVQDEISRLNASTTVSFTIPDWMSETILGAN